MSAACKTDTLVGLLIPEHDMTAAATAPLLQTRSRMVMGKKKIETSRIEHMASAIVATALVKLIASPEQGIALIAKTPFWLPAQ